MDFNKYIDKYIKTVNGKIVALFPGPDDAPENTLIIPIEDLGYEKGPGVFKKSLQPGRKSEVNLK